jgi:hypothetical protein
MKNIFSVSIPVGGRYCILSLGSTHPHTTVKQKGKGKGIAVPLQAWSGPEGSRNLRFPDSMTTAQDGGYLYPQEIHLVLISVRG